MVDHIVFIPLKAFEVKVNG